MRFLQSYGRVGNFTKVLGRAGYIGAAISGYSDYQKFKDEEIGGIRFGYRTAGTFGSLAIGAYVGGSVGGPHGVLVGGIVGGAFNAGEMMYDGYVYWNYQMSLFLTNLETGLSGGWLPR